MMNKVVVEMFIPREQAWALAQFVKRVGWSEFRANAENEDEAYRISDAVSELQKALDRAGISPR